MPKSNGHTSFICWILISTVFLSSMQVTLAGFSSANDSLFNLVTLLLAEEENEDTDKNEEENSTKNHLFAHDLLVFTAVEAHRLKQILNNPDYNRVFREVLSPPPKV